MADGTILEVDEDSLVLLDDDHDVALPDSNSKADNKADHIFRNLMAAGDLDTPKKAPPPQRNRHPSAQDHMKVFLRIRPLLPGDGTGENQNCMEVENQTMLLAHAPKDSHTYRNHTYGLGKQTHKFTFSRIFDEKTTQKEFFNATMLNTVKEFIDGQNCLVFTYGVTNSGKTYTIQGNPKDGGILPRALDVVFNSIEGKQWEDMTLKPKMFCEVGKLSKEQEATEQKIRDNVLKLATHDEPDVSSLLGDTSDVSRLSQISAMSTDSLNATSQSVTSTASDRHHSFDMETTGLQQLFSHAEERVRESTSVSVEAQGQIRFSVWVSFVEIYNEYIYDLLEPMPKKKNSRRNFLQLREDRNGVPYIRGMKEIKVSTADEAYKVLTVGQKNLQMACTKLNHNSSRSHCIFTVKMLKVVDKENPNMARISMLSFCDLAGSERYTKTQTTGERIKEAGNINTSLLTLSKCIKTLRHNQTNKDHPQIVPFRESRLTRIFQSYFSGKGRASMVVNINPSAMMFDETLHALKYSAIAKQVVVIQQPEKPPPEKKKKVESQCRSKRLVSLALSHHPVKSRETIGWATPGTMAKLMEEEEEAMKLPLPPEGDDDLEEEPSGQEEELLQLIQSLKNELLEQKELQLELESKIREEVCQEMAAQLVEIEAQYSERLKREQALLEETAEKRVDLITQSIRRTRKRKRNLDAEEEDEVVPSYMLHAEQVKRQDLEARCEDLQCEVTKLTEKADGLQSSLKKLCKEKETAVLETTKLQLDLGDSRHKLDELNSMTESIEELQQLVLESQSEVKAAEERLKVKEEQIRELQCRLSEGTSAGTEIDCENCQELVQRLTDRENEIEQNGEQLTKFQQLADMLSCDLDEKAKQLEALQAKRSESVDDGLLQKKLSELEAKIQEREQEDSDKVKELEDSLNKQGQIAKALEESLVQANEIVREKTHEADNLQEALKEKTDRVQSLEEDLSQVKEQMVKSHTDLQEQLDDYILKVNEQAEELGDLQDRFKVKCTDLETASKKANEAQAEKDELAKVLKEKESTFDTAEKKVQEIEGKISSERKQAKGRGETLETVLNEKLVLIEQLKTETSTQARTLKQKEDTISQNESKVEELKKCIADQEQKVIDLKASVETIGEKDVEINQLECDLEKVRADLKRENRRAADAEEELASYQENRKTRKSDIEQERSRYKHKVQEMQKKIDDLEYKHQMSLRQLRREKTQLDHLLKESEAALAEAKKNVSDLETSSKEPESSDNAAEHEADLKAHKDKIEKLEDVIRELEKCLFSSKEGQAQAENFSEEYRTKCHNLEDDLEARDERIQFLEDEIACAQENKEGIAADLERELSEKVGNLQALVCNHEDELQELTAKLRENDEMYTTDLNKKAEEISALASQLKEQRETMASGEGELKIALVQAQEKTHSQEEELRSCHFDIENLKQSELQHKEDWEKCESCLKRAKAELEAAKQAQLDKNETIASYETQLADLQGVVEDHKSELAAKSQECANSETRIGELTERLSEVQTKLSIRTQECETLEQDAKKHHQNCSQLEQKVAEKESLLSRLELRLEQQAEVASKKDTEAEKMQLQIVDLKSRLDRVSDDETKMKVEVESYQNKATEMQEVQQQHAKEIAKLKDSKKKIEEELETARQQLAEQKEAQKKIEELLASRETSIEAYNKQINLLNKEISLLTEQEKKNSERVTALRSQLADAGKTLEERNEKFVQQEEKLHQLEEKSEQEEAATKEAKAKTLKLKEDIEELQASMKEKERAVRQAEREKEKVERQLERAEEDVKHKERKLQTRLTKMEELTAKMETERAANELRLQDAKANELVIEELKKSLEANDTTMIMVDNVMQKKKEEIEELEKELNSERERYEALLESTKDTRQRLTELEQRGKDTGHEKEAAEAQLCDLKATLKDTQREVTRLERDKNRLGRDVKDSSQELKELERRMEEKAQEAAEAKQELMKVKQTAEASLRDKEMEEFSQRGQAQLLKQKFQTLEEQKKQLEREIELMKEQLSTAERKKDQELLKWREDRDKLVSGLEQILKQKDKEITKLKHSKHVKVEPDDNSGREEEVAQLRESLLDKDAIIAELMSQQDGPRANTRSARKSRRKPTRTVSVSASDEDTEVLKAELDSLHRKLDEEREERKVELGKVTRAKDGIIDDLKVQNESLLHNMLQQHPQPASTDMSTSAAESEPASAAKPRSRKGRSRKRKSSEHQVLEEEKPEVTPRKTKKTSRSSKSSRRTRIRLDENEDPLVPIEEEGVIDLDDVTPRKAALNNSIHLDEETAIPPSPYQERVTPMPHRRTRKLLSRQPEELSASPSVAPFQGTASEDGHRDHSHEIVTRKLRSRRH